MGPVKCLRVCEEGINHKINHITVQILPSQNAQTIPHSITLVVPSAGAAYQALCDLQGCKPAMNSCFKRKDFNEQDYRDIVGRSRAALVVPELLWSFIGFVSPGFYVLRVSFRKQCSYPRCQSLGSPD